MVNVKEKRTEKGLTLKALGKLIGLSGQSVFYIEHGVHKPKIKTAKKLGEILGVDWTKFYDDEEFRKW
jgi:DNA-binding XRE family transcriptional regulator